MWKNLDGELLFEFLRELIQLRPRALDEEDGRLPPRPRTSPRQQRVREILDGHVLRGCEIQDPLQHLLTLYVIGLDGGLDNVHPAPTPALHVSLPLQVREYPRHRVAVHPQKAGHRPDARQAAPNLEAAGQDQVLDLPLQLYVYRYVTLRVYP
jgi:hypothetical protein